MDRFDTKQFEKVLENSLSFLGRITPAGADARLLDIEVEEVSFVDRAANKRRFLTIKRRGADDMDQDKMELRLSTTVKDSLLSKLAKALEGLVPLCDAVMVAEVVGENDQETASDEITSVIDKASDLLADARAVYPMPEPEAVEQNEETTVEAETVEAVEIEQSETAVEPMTEDDFLSEIDFSTFDADFADKMKALAKAVLSIAQTDIAALASVRQGMIDAFKAAQALPFTPAQAPAVEAAVEETTDVELQAETEPEVEVDEKEVTPESEVETEDTEKRNLESQVQSPEKEPGDMGNIGTGSEEDGPAADKSDGKLGEILKSITALNRKIEKLESTPQPPASRTENSGSGEKKTEATKRPSGGRWVL